MQPAGNHGSAPSEHAVRDAIDRGLFRKRRLSWVALSGSWFLKIPRTGLSVRADASSPEARQLARQERDELTALANITDAVVRPAGLVEQYACLVLPRLHGRDLRPLLLSAPDSPRSLRAILGALTILGQIHKATLNSPRSSWKMRAYSAPRDKVAAGADLHTVVIEGFEVRNIFLEHPGDKAWFYDPHALAMGLPEDDMTRFVLSLLMLNWNRSIHCRPWTAFSYPQLLAWYQEAAGFKLRKTELRSCFRDNLDLRSTNAGRSIDSMFPVVRPLGRTYSSIYFKQIERWAAEHGL